MAQRTTLISPVQEFFDPSKGRTLAGGTLYIGAENSDPKNDPLDRYNVYNVNDDGTEILISQPIPLNGAGQPSSSSLSGNARQIRVELPDGVTRYCVQAFSNKNILALYQGSVAMPTDNHALLQNRMAVGAHDDIYIRARTLSEAIAEDAPAGTRYRITDLMDARYNVVESFHVGGVYKTGLASGRKLKLVTQGKCVLVPQIGTDTASVQQALDNFNNLDFGSPDVDYEINGTLTVRSNTKLNINKATIRQMIDQTPLFDVTNTDKVTAIGGNFVGKVESTFVNSSSSLARAFTGDNVSNLRILRNNFEGFYYSPVYVTNCYNVIFLNNVIKGIKSVLEQNTSYRNCTGGTFIGSNIRVGYNDVYEVAQGFIIGQKSRNAIVSNNNIHDLVNEHGIYCDTDIVNLSITGNIISNTGVFGTGLKVQVYDSVGAIQSKGITIAGNVISSTGSDGILLDNTSPSPLTPILGVSITGNTVIDAGAYAYNLRDTENAEIIGNVAINPALSGFFWSNCNGLSLKSNTIRGAKRSALSDGIAASNNVTLKDITIINCATDNVPGDNFGLLVQLSGSNYVVDSFNITDSLGNMEHAMYFAANINSTLSLIDNICPDSVSSAVRFGSTDPLRAYKGNYFKSAFNATTLPTVDTATAVVAGILTLPIGPEVLSVTNNAGFYYIEPAGQTGIRITLIFRGTLTVDNTSNIKLAAPFNATPDSTLTLVCDGTNWYKC